MISLLSLTLQVACSDSPDLSAIRVPSPDTCNGYAELCDRRYSDVAYAGTHNAMSNQDDGWIAPNQIHGIARQLADGIRAMMWDTYEENGQLLLCHGHCSLGQRDLVDALQAVGAFLQAERGEVLTLLLQDGIPDARMLDAIAAAGLTDIVLSHTLGEPWPTLRDMIDSDRRLVLFAESGGTTSGPIMHMWDFVWDTPYAHDDAATLATDCTENRGAKGNDLFLLNHWLYSIPLLESADEVNYQPFLGERATRCYAETGQLPNFVALNFYSLSDLTAVVNDLNGVP